MILNGTNKQTKLPISQFIFNPLFIALLPHAIHDLLFDCQTFSNWYKDWVDFRKVPHPFRWYQMEKTKNLPISQFIFNPLFTELLPHAIHDRLFDRQTFSNWHKDWVEYRVLRLSETFYILSHIAASLGKKRVETEKTWEKNWDKEKKIVGIKERKKKRKNCMQTIKRVKTVIIAQKQPESQVQQRSYTVI